MGKSVKRTRRVKIRVETIKQKKILDYVVEQEYFNLKYFKIELIAEDKIKFVDSAGDYIIFQLVDEEVKQIEIS